MERRQYNLTYTLCNAVLTYSYFRFEVDFKVELRMENVIGTVLPYKKFGLCNVIKFFFYLTSVFYLFLGFSPSFSVYI